MQTHIFFKFLSLSLSLCLFADNKSIKTARRKINIRDTDNTESSSKLWNIPGRKIFNRCHQTIVTL